LKVFVDTNVWMAVFTGSGLCAELVMYIKQRHQLVVSEDVLEGLHRKLTAKLKVPPPMVRSWCEDIRTMSIVQSSPLHSPKRSRDRKDDVILQAALEADCDWLVTGDLDLRVLKRVEKMPITSPRDFLEAMGVEEPWV
jgi:putative PIN family toxin of toxin-antitoxin system